MFANCPGAKCEILLKIATAADQLLAFGWGQQLVAAFETCGRRVTPFVGIAGGVIEIRDARWIHLRFPGRW